MVDLMFFVKAFGFAYPRFAKNLLTKSMDERERYKQILIKCSTAWNEFLPDLRRFSDTENL